MKASFHRHRHFTCKVYNEKIKQFSKRKAKRKAKNEDVRNQEVGILILEGYQIKEGDSICDVENDIRG